MKTERNRTVTRFEPKQAMITQDNISQANIYNVCDAPGFERGDNGKGKPKTARVYICRVITGNKATVHSWDVWGALHIESFPVETLNPWENKYKRKP